MSVTSDSSNQLALEGLGIIAAQVAHQGSNLLRLHKAFCGLVC